MAKGEKPHCHPGCTHEEHQYPEEPIATADQLDRYQSQIKDLGLVMTRRHFIKSAAMFGLSVLAGQGLFSLLSACSSPPANKDDSGFRADVEKPDLTIGFIPITCATPIIMADPLGFYKKHGLNVTVKKYGGWADIRDAFIAGEIDAAHLLSPMPLALSLGLGSAKVPTRLAAIENINGQALTLASKYKGKVKDVKDLKGMTFGVPFEYSMHNLLLRHYLASGGLDPDRHVQIRVTRPPDMVANLASGNLDGYLGPDPFNQRAVYENVGFIFKLSKDIWPNHPCCAFAVKQEFIDKYPKTYNSLLKAITDATNYSSDAKNREAIANAIAGRAYLNQPEEVVAAILTGNFPDGLGNQLSDPKRIDFDPFPWKSFAVWILLEFIRWGYIKPNMASTLDPKKVADEVFLTGDVRKALQELGYNAPAQDYKIEKIMGNDFDATKAEAGKIQELANQT